MPDRRRWPPSGSGTWPGPATATVYAATGDAGKVFRQATKDEAAWTVASTRPTPRPWRLAATPDGKVFAGTGPERPGDRGDRPQAPRVAARPQGPVHLGPRRRLRRATCTRRPGRRGQLWKRSRDGKWSLLFDSKATHLLCVAVGRRRHGLRRQRRRGADLPGQPRRQGLGRLRRAPGRGADPARSPPTASLYAGTAAEAGGGGAGPGSAASSRRRGDEPELRASRSATAVARREPDRVAAARRPVPSAATARPPVAGSAAPKPVSPGDNAVYRIDADGVAREVFRARALIFALAWSGDRLLVGTGPDGQLYEVRDRGRREHPAGEARPRPDPLPPGRARRRDPPGHRRPGRRRPALLGLRRARASWSRRSTTPSCMSRFGALSWRADLPAGTSVARPGPHAATSASPTRPGRPGRAEQTDPAASRAESPPGRFVQYRVKLSTQRPRRRRPSC